jgi:hypothetical protein
VRSCASGCAVSSSDEPHWGAASQADLFAVGHCRALQRMRIIVIIRRVSADLCCVCKKLSVDHPKMRPARVKPFKNVRDLYWMILDVRNPGVVRWSLGCISEPSTCIMLCQMAQRHGWHSLQGWPRLALHIQKDMRASSKRYYNHL